MFLFKEYSNYLINIHIDEKTKFYNYKYFNSMKVIVIVLNYIKIKYNILHNMSDKLTLNNNNLFFFYYFNNTLKFLNSNNNFDVYQSYVNNYSLNRYNVYLFLYLYLGETFVHKKLLNLSTSRKISINSSIKLSKFSFTPSHFIFNEVKSVLSLIDFSFDISTKNIFFKKIYYSHSIFYI